MTIGWWSQRARTGVMRSAPAPRTVPHNARRELPVRVAPNALGLRSGRIGARSTCTRPDGRSVKHQVTPIRQASAGVGHRGRSSALPNLATASRAPAAPAPSPPAMRAAPPAPSSAAGAKPGSPHAGWPTGTTPDCGNRAALARQTVSTERRDLNSGRSVSSPLPGSARRAGCRPTSSCGGAAGNAGDTVTLHLA